MDKNSNVITRRDFLHSAAIGAAVLAAGPMFRTEAKEGAAASIVPAIYVCGVCGHVEFGGAPESCPVCHAPKEKFALNNALFSDTHAKFKDVAGSHAPVITVNKGPQLVPEMPCKELSVRVGKTMHPMEESHHIKFIDWYMNDKFVTRIFPPLQTYPAVSIYLKSATGKIKTVSWCNLHGYWEAEAEA
jgi:desulfoferrodoxin-like iron-binding protein